MSLNNYGLCNSRINPFRGWKYGQKFKDHRFIRISFVEAHHQKKLVNFFGKGVVNFLYEKKI